MSTIIGCHCGGLAGMDYDPRYNAGITAGRWQVRCGYLFDKPAPRTQNQLPPTQSRVRSCPGALEHLRKQALQPHSCSRSSTCLSSSRWRILGRGTGRQCWCRGAVSSIHSRFALLRSKSVAKLSLSGSLHAYGSLCRIADKSEIRHPTQQMMTTD